mmetsp:Transcript_23137/g.58725  ORF Transcript_23137/g.58725 Transcript_23137/m.58725 type:complete len:308 (+) Transcript_23137:1382-2305(+)
MGGGVQPAAQRTLRRFRQALRRQGGLRRERARRVRGATRPRRDAPPAVRGHGAVHPQRGLTDGDGGCAAVGERAAGQPRVGSGHAHRRRLGRRVRRCERRARRAARDGGLRRRHRVHARRRACARQGARRAKRRLGRARWRRGGAVGGGRAGGRARVGRAGRRARGAPHVCALAQPAAVQAAPLGALVGLGDGRARRGGRAAGRRWRGAGPRFAEPAAWRGGERPGAQLAVLGAAQLLARAAARGRASRGGVLGADRAAARCRLRALRALRHAAAAGAARVGRVPGQPAQPLRPPGAWRLRRVLRAL